jgi:hypothetical protein
MDIRIPKKWFRLPNLFNDGLKTPGFTIDKPKKKSKRSKELISDSSISIGSNLPGMIMGFVMLLVTIGVGYTMVSTISDTMDVSLAMNATDQFPLTDFMVGDTTSIGPFLIVFLIVIGGVMMWAQGYPIGLFIVCNFFMSSFMIFLLDTSTVLVLTASTFMCTIYFIHRSRLDFVD